jgi:putative photosynthetic complex assembly protein 2
MTEFALAAGFAALVWWFTTGAILFLDGLPRATFPWSMAGATVLLMLAGYEVYAGSSDLSVMGAYTAFTCAIAIWGWLEMSFLMGFITGPRTHACLERCSGWRHFLHASQAIIYNELATVAVAGCIALATWQAPNRLALWTYVVLWTMRLSAKLNLFFGVPNVGEKFLPAHLQYLKSFFRKRSMNFLFPVSISVSTVALVLIFQKLLASEDPFTAAGLALTGSLLALAVLEHWFMVLPLPSERMWKWAMRATPPGITVKIPPG